MNKVVTNNCYGGFSLSVEAKNWLVEHGIDEKEFCGDDKWGYYAESLARHNPLLVECIETLGKAASGQCANLIVDCIESNRYRIEEYDGLETVIVPSEEYWVEI